MTETQLSLLPAIAPPQKERPLLMTGFMAKRYAYQLDDDEESEIVFLLASELEEATEEAARCHEFDEITRKPEYDIYVGKGFVPASVLMEDGWYFECSQCYRRTDSEEDEDDLEDDDEAMPIVSPVILGQRVFCCSQCLDKWQKEKEDAIVKKAKAVIDFEQRFPGATIKSVCQYSDEIRFDFEVPGLQYPVSWASGGDIALVKQVDVEAWNRYRKEFHNLAAF